MSAGMGIGRRRSPGNKVLDRDRHVRRALGWCSHVR
jgi:hypothetical protein